MTFILYKRVKNSKGRFETLYLSTTGRWIKSSGGATALSREEATARAADLGCYARPVTFRN
jgi:hypothetical protein